VSNKAQVDALGGDGDTYLELGGVRFFRKTSLAPPLIGEVFFEAVPKKERWIGND